MSAKKVGSSAFRLGKIYMLFLRWKALQKWVHQGWDQNVAIMVTFTTIAIMAILGVRASFVRWKTIATMVSFKAIAAMGRLRVLPHLWDKNRCNNGHFWNYCNNEWSRGQCLICEMKTIAILVRFQNVATMVRLRVITLSVRWNNKITQWA